MESEQRHMTNIDQKQISNIKIKRLCFKYYIALLYILNVFLIGEVGVVDDL